MLYRQRPILIFSNTPPKLQGLLDRGLALIGWLGELDLQLYFLGLLLGFKFHPEYAEAYQPDCRECGYEQHKEASPPNPQALQKLVRHIMI